MKKVFGFLSTVVLSVSLFNSPVSAAGSMNTDITVYAKLKLYFNGLADNSGKDGKFYNGVAYVPKAMIYEGTTYVPLRYFANMLGVSEVSWNSDKLQITVGSSSIAQNDNAVSQASLESQPGASTVNRQPIKWSRYVNIYTGNNIQPMIDEEHAIITSVEDIYYYPSLSLIFNGVKDTSSTDGMMPSGTNEVPKTLIFKQNTYVPLRYFATQMGIPNNEIVFDKNTFSMRIGN